MYQRYVAADLESTIDEAAARRLLNLGPEVPDAEVRLQIRQRYARFAEDPQDAFVKVPMHRIVSLSALVAERMSPRGPLLARRMVSPHIGKNPEPHIVKAFDRCLAGGPNDNPGDADLPILIGWNFTGFDLPLLRWRAMAHSLVTRATCFRYPDDTPKWKWNDAPKPRDFWKRYSSDMVDLCDILANYGASSRATLAEACAALSIPAKINGKDGRAVDGMVLAGQYDLVSQYCDEDACSLYVAFLRYLLACGDLTPETHSASMRSLAEMIRNETDPKPHLEPFAALADALPTSTPASPAQPENAPTHT